MKAASDFEIQPFDAPLGAEIYAIEGRTHLAFYAGWPTAVNAGRVAVEVFGDE